MRHVVARRRRVIASTLLSPRRSSAARRAMPLSRGHAQQVDSARAGARRTPPARPPAPDTAKPPISPKRAFFYSFLAARLRAVGTRPANRWQPVLLGAEVTWIALATKSAFDLRYARAHETRQPRRDVRLRTPTARSRPIRSAGWSARRTRRIVMQRTRVAGASQTSRGLLRLAHRDPPARRRRGVRLGAAVGPARACVDQGAAVRGGRWSRRSAGDAAVAVAVRRS